MKASINASISLNSEYDTLGELKNAGYKYIDYHFDFGKNNTEIEKDNIAEKLTERVEEKVNEHGQKILMAHAPYNYNPCDGTECFERQVLDIKRALKACARLGIDRITVHAGYGNHNADYDEMLSTNVKYYSELLPTAEKYGVMLMIENISELIYKQKFVIETADNILLLREMLKNHPLIRACWDTGHANTLALDQYENIKKLGDVLQGVHLHDNFGENDDHMTPLYGNVNFDDVMKAFIDIGYDGPFNFESLMFRGNEWPNYRRKFNEEANAPHHLFEPDHELKVYGYGIMHHIAEYMLEKYNMNEDKSL